LITVIVLGPLSHIIGYVDLIKREPIGDRVSGAVIYFGANCRTDELTGNMAHM